MESNIEPCHVDLVAERINESSWKLDITEDPESGELILPLPADLLERAGWALSDTLVWHLDEVTQQCTITKKQSLIAVSSDRGTFQKAAYIKRCTEKNIELDPVMVAMYTHTREHENRPGWQQNNLEYDLRNTSWILKKVENKIYAQNLYAALCNIRWQQREVFPILKEEFWSCSWRQAGGIIADMQGTGDYIDWYCSGIVQQLSQDEIDQLDESLRNEYNIEQHHYVSEGVVTTEIEQDLKRLGWQWSEWPEDDNL